MMRQRLFWVGGVGAALIGVASAAVMGAFEGAAVTDTGSVTVVPARSLAAAPAVTAAAGDPVYSLVGTVRPRSASQLRSAGLTSLISIGAETTDRNYSTYSKWRTYLGPLGVGKARVQTGWADIDRVGSAAYQFAKLDEIVGGMTADSVAPWLNVGYGNSKYTGGGDSGAGSPLPIGDGLTAWLAYVDAVVARYGVAPVRVTEWEIWNEPELRLMPDGVTPRIDPVKFGEFAFATAQKIRARQPAAKLLIGGFAGLGDGSSTSYQIRAVDRFLQLNAAQPYATRIPLTDIQVTYHAYSTRPEDAYLSKWQAAQAAFQQRHVAIRMGEAGAPSQRITNFALANLDWDETSQAKWDLRRVIGDLARGIETNVFTIVDLHYSGDLNPKGMLRTTKFVANSPPTNGDQTVTGTKLAYSAVRNVASIFDSAVKPVPTAGCTAPTGYTVQAFTRTYPQNVVRNMLVVWRSRVRPGDEAGGTEFITVTCTGFNFPRYKSTGYFPRYADLLTGSVYAPSTGVTVSQAGATGVTVSGLRVYDSPVALADQGLVVFD